MDEKLVKAFNIRGVTEVVSHDIRDTSFHIVHRVLRGKMTRWLNTVEFVLKGKDGWDALVSKQYFMKRGKLVYGWNFVARWEDPDDKQEILQQIVDLFRESRGYTQVTERVGGIVLSSYPLVGVGDDRNVPGGPWNFKAPGPNGGGYSHKGAYAGNVKG